jgi:hypothetical protein
VQALVIIENLHADRSEIDLEVSSFPIQKGSRKKKRVFQENADIAFSLNDAQLGVGFCAFSLDHIIDDLKEYARWKIRRQSQ